jgi:hypothetical protein
MWATLFHQTVQQEFDTENAFNSILCLRALLTQNKSLFNEAKFNLRIYVNSKNNRRWPTVNSPALHGALDTIGSVVSFQILMDPIF